MARAQFAAGNSLEAEEVDVETSIRGHQQPVELAIELRDLRVELEARRHLAQALKASRDFSSSRDEVERLAKAAQKMRDPTLISVAYHYLATFAHNAGEFDVAKHYWLDGSSSRSSPAREQVVVEYERGDFSEGDRLCVQFAQKSKRDSEGTRRVILVELIARIAHITGIERWFDLAERTGRELLANPNLPYIVTMGAVVGLGLLAAFRRDEVAAERWFREIMSAGTSVGDGGELDLALICDAAGRHTEARAYFERALERTPDPGFAYLRAWICFEFGDYLLRRGSQAEADRARELLEEALTKSRRIGMLPLAEHTAGRLDGLAGTPAASSYPDGLTEREVEVLVQLATGLTNKEIADRLSISVSTVANHIQHIFAKTQTANRTESTAYAIREGLTGS